MFLGVGNTDVHSSWELHIVPNLPVGCPPPPEATRRTRPERRGSAEAERTEQRYLEAGRAQNIDGAIEFGR